MVVSIHHYREKERLQMIDLPSMTISVPEAGKSYFGLCRNGAYAAAKRGEIPTIRIGKLLRVPVRALERMLNTTIKPGADQ
jgi:hypothetical protein